MQDNIDRHFTGTFKIGEEEITGELIYNKERGKAIIGYYCGKKLWKLRYNDRRS